MFYRLNDRGDAVLFYSNGNVVRKLDGNSYPEGIVVSEVIARDVLNLKEQ